MLHNRAQLRERTIEKGKKRGTEEEVAILEIKLALEPVTGHQGRIYSGSFSGHSKLKWH